MSSPTTAARGRRPTASTRRRLAGLRLLPDGELLRRGGRLAATSSPTTAARGRRPTASTRGGRPDSVSCPTASFCAAVDGSGNALTYNGSSWSSPDSIDANKGGLGLRLLPVGELLRRGGRERQRLHLLAAGRLQDHPQALGRQGGLRTRAGRAPLGHGLTAGFPHNADREGDGEVVAVLDVLLCMIALLSPVPSGSSNAVGSCALLGHPARW